MGEKGMFQGGIRVKSDPETEQKKHYICSTF